MRWSFVVGLFSVHACVTHSRGVALYCNELEDAGRQAEADQKMGKVVLLSAMAGRNGLSRPAGKPPVARFNWPSDQVGKLEQLLQPLLKKTSRRVTLFLRHGAFLVHLPAFRPAEVHS